MYIMSQTRKERKMKFSIKNSSFFHAAAGIFRILLMGDLQLSFDIKGLIETRGFI